MLAPMIEPARAPSEDPARDLTTSPPPVPAAHRFARVAHRDQRGKLDGAPYINHPVAVARLVADARAASPVIAAALLHDVLEKTETSAGELTEAFDTRVVELVEALTEDESIEDYGKRKLAHRDQVEAAGDDAATIYAADKVANIRDLRRVYGHTGEAVGERYDVPLDLRVELWRDDLAMLSGVHGGRPLVMLCGLLDAELGGLAGQRRAELHEGADAHN